MSRTHHHSHTDKTANEKRKHTRQRMRTQDERGGKPPKAHRAHERTRLREEAKDYR